MHISKPWEKHQQGFKKVSEYDQEIPQSHSADQPTSPQEDQQLQDNKSKAISSLFVKMIAKLGRTLIKSNYCIK